MNVNDALKIVEIEILSKHQDCALVSEDPIEYENCFVFYYQSKKYIESGNSSEMYVGHGPVILCKNTGQVFETGSAHSTEHYVHAFEACGDPHGELTIMVEISGWYEGAKKIDSTRLIKSNTELGLAKSKRLIDLALKNKSSTFQLKTVDEAKKVTQALIKMGFKAKQLWSNHC